MTELPLTIDATNPEHMAAYAKHVGESAAREITTLASKPQEDWPRITKVEITFDNGYVSHLHSSLLPDAIKSRLTANAIEAAGLRDITPSKKP